MIDLKGKLEDNYILGCVRYHGEYGLYLMPLAWWILNYAKYDPSFNPTEENSDFRKNILNVSDGEIDNFIQAIQEDRINLDDLMHALSASPENMNLSFFIDFDEKLFINGYFDNVEPEEYLPDDHWTGKLGYPIEYLPEDLKQVFKA
jgi:hypothetical protein